MLHWLQLRYADQDRVVYSRTNKILPLMNGLIIVVAKSVMFSFLKDQKTTLPSPLKIYFLSIVMNIIFIGSLIITLIYWRYPSCMSQRRQLIEILFFKRHKSQDCSCDDQTLQLNIMIFTPTKNKYLVVNHSDVKIYLQWQENNFVKFL